MCHKMVWLLLKYINQKKKKCLGGQLNAPADRELSQNGPNKSYENVWIFTEIKFDQYFIIVYTFM